MLQSFKLTLFMTAISVSCFALDSCIDPKVYHNQFGKYHLPKNQGNRPNIMRIKKGIVHELDTLLYIKEIYKPNTSIVHAGTYFGDMLPFFSKLLGENTVWAFEPVRENYLCAVANIKLNQLKNVRLFNVGLSQEKNQLHMIIKEHGRHQGGASRIATKPVNKSQKSEIVNVDSIDNLLKDNTEQISLIHLDVEGHERQALSGATQTIETYRPVIILEVCQHNLKYMEEHMKKYGYRFEMRLNNNCVYFPEET